MANLREIAKSMHNLREIAESLRQYEAAEARYQALVREAERLAGPDPDADYGPEVDQYINRLVTIEAELGVPEARRRAAEAEKDLIDSLTRLLVHEGRSDLASELREALRQYPWMKLKIVDVARKLVHGT